MRTIDKKNTLNEELKLGVKNKDGKKMIFDDEFIKKEENDGDEQNSRNGQQRTSERK